MIQFNLLPDVKIEFIKARRAKRSIMLVSIITSGMALVVMIFLFAYVSGAQKKHITDLTRDIKTYSGQVKGVKDLNKILTIQNQLDSLTGLHDAKPAVTRLFGYITSVTPAIANISEFKIDFGASTINISGGADQLSTVNTFIDTLKFTTYTDIKDPKNKDIDQSKNRTEPVKAFSNVVLTEFKRDSTKTTYKIATTFDPIIFNNKSDPILSVPHIISTRSETEKPTALFSK
jgi:hypothetical protein